MINSAVDADNGKSTSPVCPLASTHAIL